MKKTSKKNIENLYEQKEKGFSKFIKDFKTSVFGVLFLLLKDEDEEELNFFMSVGFDYFQMHYYPFQMFVIGAWNAPSFVYMIVSIANNNLDLNKFLKKINFLSFFFKLFESEFHLCSALRSFLYKCGCNHFYYR